MKKYGIIWFEIIVCLILLVWCTLNFSAFFSNFFHSDNAIQVLQIYNFHFPQDLYYRGQDRLGSLLPVLGLVPFWLGSTALLSATIIQVALWVGLAICGTFILRSVFTRIVWYAALLLPLDVVSVFVQIGHPYSAATLLILLAYISYKKDANVYWCAISTATLLSIGLWVSELTLVPIVLLVFDKIYYPQGKIKIYSKHFYFPFRWQKWLLPFLITVFSFVVLIYIVKSQTVQDGRYSRMIATPEGIVANFQRFFEVVFYNLFSAVWYVILGCWMLLFSIVVAFWASIKQNNRHIWRWFFLTCGLFAAIVLSNWVYIMSSSLHYYAAVYPFLVLWIAISVDKLRFKLLSKLALAAIFLFIILHHVNFIKILAKNECSMGNKPCVEQIEKVSASLQTNVIIGNYWHSYVFAGRHPDKFLVLPGPGEFIRGYWQVSTALSADSITIIGNGWLKSFPKTLDLYGNNYRRLGNPDTTSNIRWCIYKRMYLPFDSILNYQDLIVGFGNVVKRGADSVLIAKPENIEDLPFLIYGNYNSLNAGRYTIKFYIDYKPEKPLANKHFTIEVVANFGKKIIDRQHFGWLIDNSNNMYYQLEIDLKERTSLLEYRVLYYGNGTITFKQVIISKID